MKFFERPCPVHDAPSQAKIRRLEEELGMEPSEPTGDLVDQFFNPDLIDCGRRNCQKP